jgi:hypothetical protein
MTDEDDDATTDALRMDLDPAEFPALTGFFLGYLHEDFEIVYGSPEAAMDGFVEDAGTEDVLLVKRDWDALHARFDHLDEEHRLDLLATLGAAWQPARWSEVEALFDRLLTALGQEP